MPHFTLPISPQGPVVDAAVMITEARRQALTQAGEQAPPAQAIRALIDTGASISGVDPSVLSALSLQQTGETDILTPSTGTSAIRVPTFDVVIGIYAGRPGDLHYISDTIQVTATVLTGRGFLALIGTDVLSKCILHYNGADGIFTVAY